MFVIIVRCWQWLFQLPGDVADTLVWFVALSVIVVTVVTIAAGLFERCSICCFYTFVFVTVTRFTCCHSCVWLWSYHIAVQAASGCDCLRHVRSCVFYACVCVCVIFTTAVSGRSSTSSSSNSDSISSIIIIIIVIIVVVILVPTSSPNSVTCLEPFDFLCICICFSFPLPEPTSHRHLVIVIIIVLVVHFAGLSFLCHNAALANATVHSLCCCCYCICALDHYY